MEPFIKTLAIEAGKILLGFFGNAATLYSKAGGVSDIVTEADIASNEYICKKIKEQYPDHGIVSEEGEGCKTDADYVWYIDPLDGTKNFATHTPMFGINIAVAYKGKVTHAAIYLPYLNDFIYAEEGKGAFLNGVKVQCSSKTNWSEGIYGIGTMKLSPQYEEFQLCYNSLTGNTGWTNSLASSAVAGMWVSCGKRDWYVGPGKNAWDYLPTTLIAKEAGCMVTNFAGEPFKPGDRGIVVANPHLFPDLLSIIKKSYSS
jgi:myo-inositol-1(or 4)-monophosphatase